MCDRLVSIKVVSSKIHSVYKVTRYRMGAGYAIPNENAKVVCAVHGVQSDSTNHGIVLNQINHALVLIYLKFFRHK